MRLWSWRLRFDSELSQTNDLNIGTGSLPDDSTPKSQRVEQAGSLLVVPLGRAVSRISP